MRKILLAWQLMGTILHVVGIIVHYTIEEILLSWDVFLTITLPILIFCREWEQLSVCVLQGAFKTTNDLQVWYSSECFGKEKNFCWSTYPSTCKFCMCLFVHPFVKMTAAFTMESLSHGLHELFWYCNCCCQIFISRIAQSILGWRELTCQMKVYGDMSKIHFHWQLGKNLPWNYWANFTPLQPSTN